MTVSKKQKGFTLIEVMVVVFIIAIMAGLSFFALNQASDRRYSSQAEDFLSWLEQLSDLAMLEGAAYGISQGEQGFQAVVFYNYAWYQVSFPAPFYFEDDVQLSLSEGNGREDRAISFGNEASSQNAAVLPAIVMLPDGYMNPETDMHIKFENYSPVFVYRQDEEGINLVIERTL